MRISDWSSDVCSSDLIVVDGAYFRGADGRSGELGFLRAPTEDGGIQQVQKLVSLSGLAKHLAADGLTLADALAAERSARAERSEEHTSELQSLMRISYAVFCLKTKNQQIKITQDTHE